MKEFKQMSPATDVEIAPAGLLEALLSPSARQPACRVNLAATAARERSGAVLCQQPSYSITGYSGALHLRSLGPGLSPAAAAASAALLMSYGFGSSIDPERVLLARERATYRTLGELSDSLPGSLPNEVKALLEPDALLSDLATTERFLAGLLGMVQDGQLTSTFVPFAALAVAAVEHVRFETGKVVDSDDTVKGHVKVVAGGAFAYVEFTETYDADLLGTLNFLRDEVLKRRRGGAEDPDAELRLVGLERTTAIGSDAGFGVGAWSHGWYSVQAKLGVAEAHALVVRVEGQLWCVRLKEGTTAEALQQRCLSVLSLVDRVLGMKNATDRIVLALGCPISSAGVVSRRLGSLYLALGPDHNGVDWASIDHVVRVMPDAEDIMCLTYLSKSDNFNDLVSVAKHCSPLQCFASAALLVGGAMLWREGYDAVSALMIVLPLLLQEELMPPWRLWQLWSLSSKWASAGGDVGGAAAEGGRITAYIDLEPSRSTSSAVMALLLSVTTFFTHTPETTTEWWLCALPLGFVVLWLLVLGVIYREIQRLSGGVVTRHYEGEGGHCATTGVLGGLVVGSSASDAQIPAGRYKWIRGTSTLSQDAGYGCILCG